MEAEGSCITPKIRRNASTSANIRSLGLQSNPTNPAPVKHITSCPFDEKLLVQTLYKEKKKKDDKRWNNNVQDSQDEEEEIEQERVITLGPLNMQDFKVAKSQVAASYASEGAGMSELRQWNELYGEGGSRKREQLSYFL